MITQYSSTIANGLESVGIDYNKVAHRLNYDTNGKPLTNIALRDKESKSGNPFLFVNEVERGGNRHLIIVAKNHKGGEYVFDSYKESRGETDYSNYKPIIAATPKPQKQNTEKWRFKRALSAWKDATNTNVSTHDYIVKKAVNLEGIELKRGGFQYESNGFSHADCVMMPYRNIDGVICGFQFIDAAGAKRYLNQFEGSKSGAFAVIGNADLIGNGAIFVEGMATGLSVYHSTSNGKRTLNNARKMPVIVCLDAENLKPVIDVFVDKYGADIINVYADNDYKSKEKCNAGRFHAVKICHDLGLKSYLLPAINKDTNIKADFNETLEFEKIRVSSNRLDHALELIKFCPIQSIKKYAEKLAYVLADTVPAKMNIETAIGALNYQLTKRGVIDADLKKDLAKKIKWSVKKRSDEIRGRNRSSDKRHNTTNATNENIIAANNFNGVAFCDARGMGSGKTELMSERIKTMQSAAYITHRVALVDDACNRLGLDHYQDGDRYADKIGLCINSLQKFACNIERMPLFIDEARQVYETLLNSPTISNRQPLMDCFIALLNVCPSLHLADADLNDSTINFFKKHCKHLQFNLIENDAKPHAADHFIIDNTTGTGSNFDAAKVAILNELHNSKSGMAGCSSEKQAQCLQAFLIKNMIDPERILLITGGNKAGDYDDARQPAFLENINEEAKKYDLIIYTSVLGSGVSIINPAFEFTYLLNSNVLPANESMQMLARNRCAKRVYVAFGKDGNAGRVTDMETLKQGQIEKIKNFAADNGANITGSLNDLGLMQCESRAHINADLNDYANNFLLLAEISGRHFEHENAFIDSDGYGLKESAKETKELIISKIHNAPVLDDIDYKKLKRNYATTQQQTDAVKRFDAVKMTGAAADKLTLGDVENFNNGYASKLNNYLLIDADQKNLKELDKANHESGNNQKSLLSRQKIFKAFLKPLLDANGKIGKKEFQAACKVLKKYHLELAGEFGNYDKEKFKNAGMTVHNFLEKIGYEIAEKSTIQGVSFYEIFVNDDIARYATNRMALDGF
jgi:hypothetical protein